jgi:hypothetical protein
MGIWKLSPIPSTAADGAWETTRWYGPIVVRAKDSRQARKIAASALRKVRSRNAGADEACPRSPWLDEELVSCRWVPVSTYLSDGSEAVLRPEVIEYRGP